MNIREHNDFIVWALSRLETRKAYESNYMLFNQTTPIQRQKVQELAICITIIQDCYNAFHKNLGFMRRCKSLEEVYGRLRHFEHEGDNVYIANALHENWQTLYKWLYKNWEE